MLTSEKLSFLRKKEGWSQGELADKLNISRQSVSKWELNESLPDAENIVKISNLFNVSTDYLLKDNSELSFSESEQPIKKYYIKKWWFLIFVGIITLGIINVFAYYYFRGFSSYPFLNFVHNFGLLWLVIISAISIVTGISILIRDMYIYKSKKHNQLTPRTLKLFIAITSIISFFVFAVFIFLEYA